MKCDTCAYYIFDEDYDDYVCSVDMDEDDLGRLMTGTVKSCPFYRDGDEYKIVKKQN